MSGINSPLVIAVVKTFWSLSMESYRLSLFVPVPACLASSSLPWGRSSFCTETPAYPGSELFCSSRCLDASTLGRINRCFNGPSNAMFMHFWDPVLPGASDILDYEPSTILLLRDNNTLHFSSSKHCTNFIQIILPGRSREAVQSSGPGMHWDPRDLGSAPGSATDWLSDLVQVTLPLSLFTRIFPICQMGIMRLTHKSPMEMLYYVWSLGR